MCLTCLAVCLVHQSVKFIKLKLIILQTELLVGCSRLAFIQLLFDFIRSEAQPTNWTQNHTRRHSLQTGHKTTPDNFNIIGREDHGLARTIKDSIYIRVNNPTLNMNLGKYKLNHIWDRVLLNTPDLFQWACAQNIHKWAC